MPGRNDNGPEKYFGDRAGTDKANFHVVPDDGKWALKKEGEDEQIMQEDDKSRVVSRAKELAEEYGSMAIIHDADGKIEDQVEY